MKDEETKIIVADEIAKRIREAREARGWTAYKLAEETGINSGHIARIEQGFMAVRTDILQRICCALKLEIKFPLPI